MTPTLHMSAAQHTGSMFKSSGAELKAELHLNYNFKYSVGEWRSVT